MMWIRGKPKPHSSKSLDTPTRGFIIGFLQTPGNSLTYSPDGRTLAVVIRPLRNEK